MSVPIVTIHSSYYTYKVDNICSVAFQRTRAVVAFITCNMDYLRSGAGKLERSDPRREMRKNVYCRLINYI